MHHQHILDWLHHLPASCDHETYSQLSSKQLAPPPSIEATTWRKRRMEEEPDNGGAAEEVTPRPRKKRRNRDDTGPSQSPNLRRRRSIAVTSRAAVSTGSITTSRSRHASSDVAARLEVAYPAIHVGSLSTLTVPPQVVRIHTLLDDTRYLTQFVPNISNVIAGLRAMHVQIPNSCLSQTTFTRTTYDDQEQDRDGDLAAHFVATALSIVHLAQTVFNDEYNEANWYPLVRAVLAWPTPSSSDYLLAPPNSLPPFLTNVLEARDISVSHEYLPTYAKDPSAIISGVKVDHLITLNNRHPRIAAVRDQVLSGDFNRCFSPFVDRRVARSFVVALVEVKAPGGNRAESQVRLAAAAVLEAVKRVGDKEGRERGRCRTWMEELPVVCFVVNGHSWEARVGYWESEESIRILGPIIVGNTASFVDVCRLLKVMEVLKSWAEDTYLPSIMSKLRRVIEEEGEDSMASSSSNLTGIGGCSKGV
ncbi:MAG: hypothetical protein M1813_005391 [Trichoglossum hirsutum]|nr:MAG: hypothetical protein M1813_005391 [Trichoglossum hirsutum]